MKRTITIYLRDGRTLQRDYHDFATGMGVPLGAAINHPAVVNIARSICLNGLLDPDNTDQHNITWLGPAQISRVSITEVQTIIKA